MFQSHPLHSFRPRFLIFNVIFWSGFLLLAEIAHAGFLSRSFPGFSSSRCIGTHESLGKFFTQAQQSICGQPLAISMIRSSLLRHFENDTPKGPLVMSWHGDSGLGKSSLADLLSESFNTITFTGQDVLGDASDFLVESDQSSSSAPRNYYNLKNAHQRVYDAISACSRTIVIFDDADLIPSTVIEQMNQFIDGSKKTFAAKATFIFIMNLGLHEIHELSRDIPLPEELSILHNPTDENLRRAKDHPDDFSELKSTRFVNPSPGTAGFNAKMNSERHARVKELKSFLYVAMSDPPQVSSASSASLAELITVADTSTSISASVSTSSSISEGEYGSGQRRFLNQLVTRNLIQFTVPFFPMTMTEVTCCIDRELMLLRHEYTSMKRKMLHIPLADISLKWFGYEKRTLGFHSLEWNDLAPYNLALMNEFDVNQLSITGCRSAKSIVTTEIVGAIDAFVQKSKDAFEKEEAKRRRKMKKNQPSAGDRSLSSSTSSSWTGWFQDKSTDGFVEKMDFYNIDVFIHNNTTVAFSDFFQNEVLSSKLEL